MPWQTHLPLRNFAARRRLAAGRNLQRSEQFYLPFLVGQISPTEHGTEPSIKSFLEIQDEYLHVSTVKRSEDGQGWIVRLLNPYDKAVQGKIRFNQGMADRPPLTSPVERIKAELTLPERANKPWSSIREVTLEETPLDALTMDKNGWFDITIAPKKIMTVKFQA